MQPDAIIVTQLCREESDTRTHQNSSYMPTLFGLLHQIDNAVPWFRTSETLMRSDPPSANMMAIGANRNAGNT